AAACRCAWSALCVRHSQHVLLSSVTHMWYKRARAASPMPTPSSAHLVAGGLAMTFEEILDQAIAMLQRRGRVTYQTLRLQFQLNEEHLEALKEAILFAYPQVVDAAGRGLVWSGEASATPPPAPA